MMSWREAWQLTNQLLTDPSSRVFGAVAGWPHPWSHETFVLADLYDLLTLVHTDRRAHARVEPYPRPSRELAGRRIGRPDRSQSEIREALAARGHVG